MQVDVHICDASAIVPAYQASGTIGRALSSVAKQTVKPREVVVVFDGPDPEARRVAESYRNDLAPTELLLIDQPHSGPGAARNRALQAASQRYAAFLDADDEWLPEKLEESMKRFSPGTVLVSHNVVVDDGSSEMLVDCARHFRADGSDNFPPLYRKGFISTSTTVIDRRFALDLGGFDESLPNAQDFDLWLKMVSAPNAKIHVFEEALTRYHVTTNSIMSNTWRRLECGLRIAIRYLPQLRKSGAPVFKAVWYRVAAIHFETLTAYGKRKDYPNLLRTMASLPVRLTTATLAAFLQGPEDIASSRSHPAITWMLFAWLLLVLGVYLLQFRPMAAPILELLRSLWPA